MEDEIKVGFEEGPSISGAVDASEAQQAAPPSVSEIRQVNVKLDLLLKALGVDTTGLTEGETYAND